MLLSVLSLSVVLSRDKSSNKIDNNSILVKPRLHQPCD